jgi:hypothetical protein
MDQRCLTNAALTAILAEIDTLDLRSHLDR